MTLNVTELSVPRGGLPVCRGVSLEVNPGEVAVLLGPNGAGKSTLLDAIAGVTPSSAGTITLADTDITKVSRSRRAADGLAYVEQGRSIFATLTVEENLLVSGDQDTLADAYRRFPRLQERRLSRADLLSGGEQQMLVIARALSLRPKVLMLDEMSLGLAPIIVQSLLQEVRKLADDQHMAILLVEQFAALALEVGDRAYVLQKGEIVFAGTTGELSKSRSVIEHAYLAIDASSAVADPAVTETDLEEESPNGRSS